MLGRDNEEATRKFGKLAGCGLRNLTFMKILPHILKENAPIY